MVVLPFPPRRASLQSFWLALCLLGAVAIGMLAWATAVITVLFGVLLVVFPGLAGVIWPQIATWPYRSWNKLARIYACAAEWFVLRICYWTVMVAGGWTGTHLRLGRPGIGESLWIARQSLEPSLYKRLHSCSSSAGGEGSWISRYGAWAWGSKQPWLLALLPFLCILLWLKGEEESVVRESIYTLF